MIEKNDNEIFLTSDTVWYENKDITIIIVIDKNLLTTTELKYIPTPCCCLDVQSTTDKFTLFDV